jgi:mRNA interferase MazF
VRGDVYRLRHPRNATGHEQHGPRYAVVVQSSALDVLSTWVVAPTSTSALPAAFRAAVEIAGRETLVLCEQATAVSHSRLGEHVGFLRLEEMQRVDDALRLVFDL